MARVSTRSAPGHASTGESGRSRAWPARRTCRPPALPISGTRSSASWSRRHAWASRPSSTRRACTASWPETPPASRSRSARPPRGIQGWSKRSRDSSGAACERWVRARPSHRSWTWPATRAGDASRRRTERIPTLWPCLGARTCAASSRPAMESDLSSPRPSTWSAMASRKAASTRRRRTSESESCTTSSCCPSRPPCVRWVSARSCMPTTTSTGSPVPHRGNC